MGCGERRWTSMVLLALGLACSSERAGSSGAGGAGASGGAAGEGGGAGEGGSGGAGQAMCSPWSPSQSEGCRACVAASCGAQASACFGAGWLSGDATGSSCADFVGCYCGCADGDLTCQGACFRAASAACGACIQQMSRCICDGCGAACGASPMGCSSGASGAGGAAQGRSLTCASTGAGAWHCTCYDGARLAGTCDTTAAEPCVYPSCCSF